MPHFSEAAQAAFEKKAIGASWLVHMDFVGTPRRWWTGFGTLDAGHEEWQGLGHLIGIDGIEHRVGTAAPQATFTVTGVDPDVVVLAKSGAVRVRNRRVVVYLQLFHITPSEEGNRVHSTLDEPYAMWSGKMQQVQFSGGFNTRTIMVTAETLWVQRNRPPFGLYTDRDTDARFPGDKGLRQVASLVSKSGRWPTS